MIIHSIIKKYRNFYMSFVKKTILKFISLNKINEPVTLHIEISTA